MNPDEMGPVCRNCSYWDGSDPDDDSSFNGVCRRYPETVIVNYTDYCGEWRKAGRRAMWIAAILDALRERIWWLDLPKSVETALKENNCKTIDHLVDGEFPDGNKWVDTQYLLSIGISEEAVAQIDAAIRKRHPFLLSD